MLLGFFGIPRTQNDVLYTSNVSLDVHSINQLNQLLLLFSPCEFPQNFYLEALCSSVLHSVGSTSFLWTLLGAIGCVRVGNCWEADKFIDALNSIIKEGHWDV